MKIRWLAIVLLLTGSTVAEARQASVPCEVLIPVLDAKQEVVTATAPDGKSYPVFRLAEDSKLVDAVRHEFAGSFAQEALQLDRYARNLVMARKRTAQQPAEEWLTAPMYLLLSTEEGGFPRFGFWLEANSGTRKLMPVGYVDLVVDGSDIETGNFEEIFSHELGHLILKALTGGVGDGLSRKMHQSMTVTDFPTAFDEGYAEHFQPLVRDATKNQFLRKVMRGTGPNDLNQFWLSAVDTELRTYGVKRNLFIHRKAAPASALEDSSDLYRVFIESETSTAFLPIDLKSGQEMMASEGVIATIFYRIVNDKQLREKYRERDFYRTFIPEISGAPEKAVSPYQNVNLKLFAAMAELSGKGRERPGVIEVIEQYGRLFPDEKKRIYSIFIEATWGATVSRQLAAALEHASQVGGRGDMEGFRKEQPYPMLDSVIEQAVKGEISLDAAVGPELWILNSNFKIAGAAWSTDRSLPLTINLNTATEAELMTIPNVDLALARKIVAARKTGGYFSSPKDLESVVPPVVFAELNSMTEQMNSAQAYPRK